MEDCEICSAYLQKRPYIKDRLKIPQPAEIQEQRELVHIAAAHHIEERI